jgi:hypothetical protein
MAFMAIFWMHFTFELFHVRKRLKALLRIRRRKLGLSENDRPTKPVF